MKASKKAQAQIITTVLLILISIGAVAVVSVFIFNLVTENLGGTDCFKTAGQYEVLSGDEGATCVSGNTVKVTVQRGSRADYNLTALSITIEGAQKSKAFRQETDLPDASEKNTFTLDISGQGLGAIQGVSVVPIVGRNKACEEGKTENEDVSSACA